MARETTAVNGAAFVRTAIARAIAQAPRGLGPYHRSLRSSLGQIWTGNRELHYEVWRRARLGVVEVGLHFESDLLTNARLLGAFRGHEAEVRRALGRAPHLEEWDRGWTRIYEAHPLAAEDLVERCAARLAAYVRALEPILREELPRGVSWRMREERVSRRRRRPLRAARDP